MSTTTTKAIVAGHGTFAAGLVSAVEQITGLGVVFAPLSNAGRSLQDIQAALGDLLEETGARVVFTDLPAGSCTMAVRRLLRDRPGIVLVTGTNLSMLLDFAMQAGDTADSVTEAAGVALERGRAAMALVSG